MNIELINSTPFIPLQFESIDSKLNHFGVVVVRGTFDIENGKQLLLSKDQQTLVLEDKYFGEPGKTSLRCESSLAPYKPKTDVLIEATAYSPSGKAERNWISSLRAGPIEKSLQITGPRQWTRRMGVHRLTETEPIEKLDVRYEYAFGGTVGADDASRFSCNPVGLGFGAVMNGVDDRCPQILPIDVELPKFGRPIRPEGIGPIAPSWEPRLQRAGTLDDHWKETRAPYLPKDFSFEFYNAASPGLTFPGFAKGDEVFQLSNLSQERELAFGLPQISLMTLIQFEDGRLIPGPVNLDTIELQIEDKQAFLQWRGIYPAHIPIRKIEVRMSAPDYMIES